MNIYEDIDNFQYMQSDDLNNCFFMLLNPHTDFDIWGLTIFWFYLILQRNFDGYMGMTHSARSASPAFAGFPSPPV
jgi:hypothetical protein